ncbi:MAG: hypothetical protein WAW17_20220, partial [Rhodococcus sp. (in: high G+C Gram-positive bacteria)]
MSIDVAPDVVTPTATDRYRLSTRTLVTPAAAAVLAAGAGQPSVALPATITGQNLEVWFELTTFYPAVSTSRGLSPTTAPATAPATSPGHSQDRDTNGSPHTPGGTTGKSSAITANTMNAGSTSSVSAFDTPLPALRSTYGRLSQPRDPGGWGNSSRDCCPVDVHAEISDPVHPAHELSIGQMEWGRDLFTGVS